MQEEYAVWKQLSPAGLPPPPHKHARAILYEFEVQKVKLFEKKKADRPQDSSVNTSKDASKAEPPQEEEKDAALIGLVTTLEVWSQTFTERYNIYLSAKNSINQADMRLETLGFPVLTWMRTCVFDSHNAPSARDSPGLCHDGKDGLLFFGGKTNGGDYKTFFNDLWRFDYTKNKWHMYSEAEKYFEHGKWKLNVGLKVYCKCVCVLVSSFNPVCIACVCVYTVCTHIAYTRVSTRSLTHKQTGEETNIKKLQHHVAAQGGRARHRGRHLVCSGRSRQAGKMCGCAQTLLRRQKNRLSSLE